MESDIEFGFNFRYRNLDFRCSLSFDDDFENPYWGIRRITENINTRPKIFDSLKQFILHSGKGFHNNEYNSPEWVISDYEMKELIVEKFVSLANLIYNSESCAIID